VYEKLNLTISLHRKHFVNVFYFKKRTENKKNVKKRKNRDKNEKRKGFYIYAGNSALRRVQTSDLIPLKLPLPVVDVYPI